jgi:hypothetical protein
MLYYRDTSTILYRVQQHCRKIVPQIISQQTSSLASSRATQRGVLDVTDSLAMIDTLNGPVQRSFADIVRRAANCAHMLGQQAREAKEEMQRKERARAERMDAASSLPTTPVEGEPRIPRTPASASFASVAQTPSRRAHPNTPVPTAATPRTSSSTATSKAPTPRPRLSGIFSPSTQQRLSTTAPPAVQEEEHSIDLHPSLTRADPHDHELDDAPHVHEHGISAFVP